MTVVIDVNIWISLIITGKLNKIEDILFLNRLRIATDDKLIAELYDVLSRKKIRKYLSYPPLFYIDRHLDLTFAVDTEKRFVGSPDPNDDFLFDLAQQSGAKYLITGDKKLLKFHFDNLEIISLKSFTDMFSVK